MKFHGSHLRPTLALFLALSVVSAFTLSSFAAPQAGENPVASRAQESSAPAGTLSGTGTITINGNAAEAGATVLSGSTIATGADGNASIQLGALGRITLAPNTSVTLTLVNGRVELVLNGSGAFAQSLPPGVAGLVRTQGEHSHFVVSRGRLDVMSSDGARTLNAGEEAVIGNAREVATTGEAMFSLETVRSRRVAGGAAGGGSITAGQVGVITLVGVAAATALGIMAGQNSRGSAPKASTVVP